MKRVVITGMGILSPIGNDFATIENNLRQKKSGIEKIDELRQYNGMKIFVGGRVKDINFKEIPRSLRKVMGPQAIFAVLATKKAIANAKLDMDNIDKRRISIACSSTMGSAEGTYDFVATFIKGNGTTEHKPTSFFKMFPHTNSASIAMYFGIKGRIFSPAAACASALQSIGMGYENIKHGLTEVMICGGAEECHIIPNAMFQLLNTVSDNFNDDPHRSSRPFDIERRGLVIGEGAGILILEELEHALNRGAEIYAEVVGYSTTSNGEAMSTPSVEDMSVCMSQSLDDAGLKATDVNYVNGHFTATVVGDQFESKAIGNLFGNRIPVGSLKGFMGHTLGASGSIESIICMLMMKNGFIAPNINLDNLDPECAKLNYNTEVLNISPDIILKNSFAMGGINCSIVYKKFEK